MVRIPKKNELVREKGGFLLPQRFFARSFFILPTSQNRHSSHCSVTFYFTDESEPSLVSSAKERLTLSLIV